MIYGISWAGKRWQG